MKSKLVLKEHFKRSLYLSMPHIVAGAAAANLVNAATLYTFLNPFACVGQSFNRSFVLILASFMLFIVPEYVMRVGRISVYRAFFINFMSKLIFLESFSLLFRITGLPSSNAIVLDAAVVGTAVDIYEMIFAPDTFVLYATTGLLPALCKRARRLVDSLCRRFAKMAVLIAGTCFVAKLLLWYVKAGSRGKGVSMLITAWDVLCVCAHLFIYLAFTSVIRFCYVYNTSLVDDRYLDSIEGGTTSKNRFYYHQISDSSRNPATRNRILKSKETILFLKTYVRNEVSGMIATLEAIEATFQAVESKKFHVVPVILYAKENIPNEFAGECTKQVLKKTRSYNFVEIFTAYVMSTFSRKRLLNDLEAHFFWLRDMALYVKKMQAHDDTFGLLESFFRDFDKDLARIREKLHDVEHRTRIGTLSNEYEQLLRDIRKSKRVRDE